MKTKAQIIDKTADIKNTRNQVETKGLHRIIVNRHFERIYKGLETCVFDYEIDYIIKTEQEQGFTFVFVLNVKEL